MFNSIALNAESSVSNSGLKQHRKTIIATSVAKVEVFSNTAHKRSKRGSISS